ncbi:MAG: virulence RhuM family protein [Desulfobacteraceae bacterium]|nr:virulence RhuM family protein [Desulfobacteraceae bacterium]
MTKKKTLVPATGEFLLYTAADGRVRIETRMQGETVWLNQKQLAELFQTSIPNINMHIKNIFDEGELSPEATIQDFLTVRMEGNREVQRSLTCYNLDMIISVGYRIKSHVATHFRQWATERLREYIVKGFTMDDERLKQAGGGNYFDELLARIRDIRSSEKVFWRKVLDIYATSIDYDPATEASCKFFAAIQNKMHWAAHGQTAAEVIHSRADAVKPNMGMKSWAGVTPRKSDTEVAKNYLDEQELDVLNRIVTAYLEFAELQAFSRKPMYMADWIVKLDDFLKLSGREILTHAGKVSHEEALRKAHDEFMKYRHAILGETTQVERDFLEAAKMIEKSGKHP